MNSMTLRVLVIGAVLAFSRSLCAQVENSLVGVPVRMWATATALSTEEGDATLTISGHFLPATIDGSDGVDVEVTDSTGTENATLTSLLQYSSSQQYVRLEVGKSYEVSLGGDHIPGISFSVVPPPGYRVIINDKFRQTVSTWGTATVMVLPARGGHPHLAGMATELGRTEVDWSVSLGSQKNGTSAGDLELVQTGFRSSWSTLFTPAALSCEPASEEVYVYRDTNVIRQVVANQVALDIVTLSSTSYEIRCYNPAQLSGSTYPKSFTGQPYVTYRIEKGATDTTLNFTREFRNVPDATTTTTSVTRTDKMSIVRTGTSWPSYTWTKTDWTLDGQTALSQTVVTGAGTSSSRTETIAEKIPGGATATSLVKNFGIEASILEVNSSEVLGTTNSATVAFNYYNDTSKWGSFGYLKSAALPGGGWTAFDYYDDSSPTSTQANQVKYRYRPFVDSPSSITQSTSQGEVTYYEYTSDVFGAMTRPTLIETKVNGTTVGKTTISYSDVYQLYWGTSLNYGTEVTRTEYTDSAQSLSTVERRYSASFYDSLARGQLWSVKKPDGSKVAYDYNRGNWDGSTFTPWSGNTASRIRMIAGTANGTATESGTVYYDLVYLVDGKSTCESTIRDSRGLTARTESQVWKNGAWQLVGYVNYTYDFVGRLTQRVGNNGATYTASWDGDRKTSETDEYGVTTSYTYDVSGRVSVKTRGSSGAIGALATQMTYDAANRVLTETVGYGQSNPMVTSHAYDDAGRLTAETPPGNYGAVTHGYNVANRTHTVTRADSSTVIETKNIDGSLGSKTGTGVVNEYTTYGVRSGDAFRWVKVNQGSSNSSRWKQSWSDWTGRPVRTEHPGYTGQDNVVEENFYDEGGRRSKSTRTGYAATFYQYNPFGQMIRSGLDLDQNGYLDLYTDRVTDTETYLESYNSAWWMRTDTKTYMVAGSNVPVTTSISRTKLTGLATNRLSESQSVDAEGNVTTQTVDVNRSAKTATKTTTKTGLSQSQTESLVNGFTTSTTSFDGLTTSFGYDGFLRKSTVTDSRSNPTTTTYVTATALVSTVTDAGSNVVAAYDYYSTGAVKWQRDARNFYTRTSYTARGEVERQWGSGTLPVEYCYDAYGARTAMRTFRTPLDSSSSPYDFTGTNWPLPSSDTLNDVASTPPASGDRTRWVYDGPSGLLTSKVDAAGRSVSQTYNVRGQTAVRTLARGVTTTYSYDGSTGELLSQTYSDSTPSVAYTYGRTGQLETVTDTTGTRDLVYDSSKPWRLAAEAESSFYGGRVFTRVYDETTMPGRVRGFQVGTAVGSNSDLEQTYGYTSAGRFETVTSSRLGGTNSRTFRYSYLANSALLQSLAIDEYGGPGGHPFTITRAYESARDLVASVEAKWSTTSRTKFAYVYDERGQRTSVVQSGDVYADYGDSTFRLFAYNGRGELTQDIGYLGSTVSDQSKPLPGRRHEYDFDNIGNRNSSNRSGVSALRDDYTANALNQYVTKENNSIPVSGTADVDTNPTASTPDNGAARVAVKGQSARAGRQGKFWADEVVVANNDDATTPHPWRGPITAFMVKHDSGGDVQRSETRLAEIPGRTQNFTYDYDGNVTSDGVFDYTWDAENRLIGVVTSAFALAGSAPFTYRRMEFRYDYLGRRVQKRVLEGTATSETEVYSRRYLYDGWSMLAEYAAPGGSTMAGLLRSYTWGLDIAKSLTDAGGVGALLQIHDYAGSGKDYLPSYDGNGNIAALFDADASTSAIACVAAYEYSPYGESLRCEGTYAKENPFRFSTKFTDDETGLVYYGRRYYSPSQGRFLGRDPIEEQGGLNLYGFVSNSPINRWDVLGCDGDEKDDFGDIDKKIARIYDELHELNGGSEIADPYGALRRDLLRKIDNNLNDFVVFEGVNTQWQIDPVKTFSDALKDMVLNNGIAGLVVAERLINNPGTAIRVIFDDSQSSAAGGNGEIRLHGPSADFLSDRTRDIYRRADGDPAHMTTGFTASEVLAHELVHTSLFGNVTNEAAIFDGIENSMRATKNLAPRTWHQGQPIPEQGETLMQMRQQDDYAQGVNSINAVFNAFYDKYRAPGR